MKKAGLLGVLITLMVSLYGCATAVSSGYGQGGQDIDGRSFEAAREDNRISGEVTMLLVKARDVPAIDIDVRTRDGVVTLVGSVPDRVAARRAEAIADSVRGVKRVINRLQFQP